MLAVSGYTCASESIFRTTLIKDFGSIDSLVVTKRGVEARVKVTRKGDCPIETWRTVKQLSAGLLYALQQPEGSGRPEGDDPVKTLFQCGGASGSTTSDNHKGVELHAINDYLSGKLELQLSKNSDAVLLSTEKVDLLPLTSTLMQSFSTTADILETVEIMLGIRRNNDQTTSDWLAAMESVMSLPGEYYDIPYKQANDDLLRRIFQRDTQSMVECDDDNNIVQLFGTGSRGPLQVCAQFKRSAE